MKARDGLELPIHVYLPPGSDSDNDGIPDKPLPTVLYVHGGPWVGVAQWNNWFHTRNFQLLANRGYAVINTEFRGATGMGKAFVDAGDKEWGRKMHYDKVDVSRWAIDQGIAATDKLAIWGWSYGSYATNAALAFSPDLFACGLSMYGPADLDAFCRIPFTDSELWRSRVGNPNTAEGTMLLQKYSPQNYIHQIKKPLLLTTGSKDARVPQSQVDNFANALAEAGKEVIYFYYQEEGHDYRAPESWISFWAVGEQFLHDHIGGKQQPSAGDFEKGNLKVVHGQSYIEGMN